MGRNSDYNNGMYQQLMEVMGRLDSVEKEHKQEVRELQEELSDLKKENTILRAENQLQKEDNARLKSIINNDSSNTSLPPSMDQKGGKPANSYNGRKKTERKPGGQNGHTGTTLEGLISVLGLCLTCFGLGYAIGSKDNNKTQK